MLSDGNHSVIGVARWLSGKESDSTPGKVLVIPRKWWLRPDMTEKLLTGTLKL